MTEIISRSPHPVWLFIAVSSGHPWAPSLCLRQSPLIRPTGLLGFFRTSPGTLDHLIPQGARPGNPPSWQLPSRASGKVPTSSWRFQFPVRSLSSQSLCSPLPSLPKKCSPSHPWGYCLSWDVKRMTSWAPFNTLSV